MIALSDRPDIAGATEPGVYSVADQPAYHRRLEPSYSRIKRAVGAPIAAYWAEPTGLSKRREVIMGAAVDAVWSFGEAAWEGYPVQPSDRSRWATTKAGKAWTAEQREAGRTPLTKGEAEQVRGTLAELAAHPLASALRECGEPQVAWLWREPASGTTCRGMADLVVAQGALDDGAPGCIVDLKTTGGGAGEHDFARTAARLHYDIQAALYTDALSDLLGETCDWLWIVAEITPPHRVEVYQASEAVLSQGRERYQDVLVRLREVDGDTRPQERSFTPYEPQILPWPAWG